MHGCRPICPAPAGSTSDPTNSIIGNRNLIRVAVAWAPEHVLPLWGTYEGPPDAFLGMDAGVRLVSRGLPAAADLFSITTCAELLRPIQNHVELARHGAGSRWIIRNRLPSGETS